MDTNLIFEILPFFVLVAFVLITYFSLNNMNKKSAKFILEFTRRNGYELLDQTIAKKIRNPPFWFGSENQINKITDGTSFKLLENSLQAFNRGIFRNGFKLKIEDINTTIFSYQYSQGKSTYYFKGTILELGKEKLPNFVLEPEHFFNRFLPDIDFKRNENFSKMYRLTSDNEEETKRFFNYEKLKQLEINKIIGKIETNNNKLLYLEKGRFSNKEENYKEFISNIKKIMNYFD